MGARRSLLPLVLIFSAALVACSAAPQPGASDSNNQQPTVYSGPTAALTLEQAQQAAGDFLNDWNAGRYDAMYGLLHVKSQGTISQADFVSAYQSTAQTLSLQPNGLSYTFGSVLQQDDQAQIGYDLTFRTQTFGTFTDSGRVLHLEQTPVGWRVAWSMGDVFAEMADGAALSVTTTTPNRGSIYDRNGLVLADQNGQQIEVSLLTESYPTNDPAACFTELAQLFPARNAQTLTALYSQFTGKAQAYVVGILTSAEFAADKTALEKVCQVQYRSQPSRQYPNGGLAPHVVGYVGHIPAGHEAEWAAKGYSPDAIVGLDGIEGQMESTLAGRGSATLTLRLNGQDLRTLVTNPGVPAQSVYLTIDANLQQAVQDTLTEAYQSSTAYFYNSKGGAAIVMDVHTGETLALASYPSFDENALIPNSPLPNAADITAKLLTDPTKPTLDRATLGTYPLGSVFKIVSMAAAVDSGQFSLGTRAGCPGTWNGTPLGDRLRTNWNPAGNGIITLEQALTASCDTYFWHVGWTLNSIDPTLLPRYAQRFGFGSPTGVVGLPEAAGSVPDPSHYPQTEGKNWTGSDALDLVIGQGTLLVTPLQAVRMVAAVANGGTLYQPLIVKQTGLINQPSFLATPTASTSPGIKPEVLAGIRQAMCAVPTDPTLGTATFVFRGFDFSKVAVCGKTGTAESGQAQPHAWFAAFAGKSADDPDIAVIALVENSYEGSYIAAPIVRRIIENYYGLPIAPWPAWYGPTPETVDHGGD